MTRREEYDGYELCHRVARRYRMILEDGITKMIAALKEAGVALHEGNPPMSDVRQIVLSFMGDGDFRLDDLSITGDTTGCYVVVCLEPYRQEESDVC